MTAADGPDDQSAARAPGRLTARPLPPRPWRRGLPHPTRSPEGHLYGAPEPDTSGPWPRSEAFLHGIELFERGYYWEAHEAWEALWRRFARDTPERLLMQSLILHAAARFHEREGNAQGASRARRLAAARWAAAGPDVVAAGGLRAAGPAPDGRLR